MRWCVEKWDVTSGPCISSSLGYKYPFALKIVVCMFEFSFQNETVPRTVEVN